MGSALAKVVHRCYGEVVAIETLPTGGVRCEKNGAEFVATPSNLSVVTQDGTVLVWSELVEQLTSEAIELDTSRPWSKEQAERFAALTAELRGLGFAIDEYCEDEGDVDPPDRGDAWSGGFAANH